MSCYSLEELENYVKKMPIGYEKGKLEAIVFDYRKKIEELMKLREKVKRLESQ